MPLAWLSEIAEIIRDCSWFAAHGDYVPLLIASKVKLEWPRGQDLRRSNVQKAREVLELIPQSLPSHQDFLP